MRISPALLLLMLVTLVFAPSIQAWVTQGEWYRPYQVWLGVIIFVGWTVNRARLRLRSAATDSAAASDGGSAK